MHIFLCAAARVSGGFARERHSSEFSLQAMVERVERLYEGFYAAKQAQSRRYRPLGAPAAQVGLSGAR